MKFRLSGRRFTLSWTSEDKFWLEWQQYEFTRLAQCCCRVFTLAQLATTSRRGRNLRTRLMWALICFFLGQRGKKENWLGEGQEKKQTGDKLDHGVWGTDGGWGGGRKRRNWNKPLILSLDGEEGLMGWRREEVVKRCMRKLGEGEPDKMCLTGETETDQDCPPLPTPLSLQYIYYHIPLTFPTATALPPPLSPYTTATPPPPSLAECSGNTVLLFRPPHPVFCFTGN